MNKQLLKEALTYLNCGFVPVAICGKEAVAKWKIFKERKPTVEEVKAMFSRPGITGVAVVCGRTSGIVVVDIDEGADTSSLDFGQTLTAKTGGGGMHYFFKYEAGLKNRTGFRLKMDFRTDGGLAVLPPSQHSSGRNYEWVDGFDPGKITPMPSWLIDELKSKTSKSQKASELAKISTGVSEGERNSSAARIIGKILVQLDSSLWESTGWVKACEWNTKNAPPLDESELRSVFDSIANAELSRRNQNNTGNASGSERNQLIELIKSQAELFCDQNDKAYAVVMRKGRREIIAIQSEDFSSYVSHVAYSQFQRPLTDTQQGTVVKTLEAEAKFGGGKIHELHLRTAWHAGSLWYDLGDGRAVEINSSRWKIINNPPILFRRFKHQQVQVTPVPGGKLENVLKYLNIGNRGSEHAKILLLTYAVVALIPDIARAILVLHGVAGSAKSTFFVMLKRLIDPSSLETMTFPKNNYELIQLLSHHFFVCFDNMSMISDASSDNLCRACTGQALSKRELYTNDDDVLYYFKRAIGLTGVSQVAIKPDLLDRSLIFELQPISEEERKDETDLLKDFETDRPKILGAMFTALADAMRIHGAVNLQKKPRLADYAKWCVAVALALGYKEDDFISAFSKNIELQNNEAIDSSPTAQAVIDYFEACNLISVEKPARELFGVLKKRAKDSAMDKEPGFPKSAGWLWRKIKEIKTNLRRVGIDAQYDDSVRPRRILLRKIGKPLKDADNAVTVDDPGANESISNDSMSAKTPERGYYTYEDGRPIWHKNLATDGADPSPVPKTQDQYTKEEDYLPAALKAELHAKRNRKLEKDTEAEPDEFKIAEGDERIL